MVKPNTSIARSPSCGDDQGLSSCAHSMITAQVSISITCVEINANSVATMDTRYIYFPRCPNRGAVRHVSNVCCQWGAPQQIFACAKNTIELLEYRMWFQRLSYVDQTGPYHFLIRSRFHVNLQGKRRVLSYKGCLGCTESTQIHQIPP